MASLPTPKSEDWERLANLRHAITNDIAGAELECGEIAARRRVTKRAVLALMFSPEQTSLCVHCQASGAVDAKPCRACLGLGYTSGVTIA